MIRRILHHPWTLLALLTAVLAIVSWGAYGTR
jgi:hypothetical protein